MGGFTMRKTIEVEVLKNKINGMLLHSSDDCKDGRSSLGLLLEEILQETGNYKGFKYLSKSDMIESRGGVSFGINREVDEKEKFNNTDFTRVMYY
jgi:hypothetical protein